MATTNEKGTLVRCGRGCSTYTTLSRSVHVMRNPAAALDGPEKAWLASWTDCLGQKREQHFRLLRHVRAWLVREEA